MPNKESFTFSDKLRKSKSVPLSKRLPSIVGGKNTQKRTLVQRAQRDLPFILVAALALLLLPFLSRTGSDDIASTDNIAWNTMSDAPSFVEGGGADIMPEGSMQDPMKWIIGLRNDVKESGATMGADASKSAYGSDSSDSGSRYGGRYGDDSRSGYGSSKKSTYSSGSTTTKTPAKSDYNTRKSYDESYTTTKTKKAPATSTYGKKTRPSVRKSFERKGTDINRALRISQMPGGKGAAGISHTLPIGQGPSRGSSGGSREGIRPIALQPMEARGNVGRSMTGENLYAEASRSIGAMNAGGPAKANLLAAQMRDVDGRLTPEGVLGGPGTGASVRPGSGGAPGNNNSYGIQKPWWWDMMNTRSQKMWDLMYYKPREMFYTNLYKIGLGVFNCLATGNKDGDVSTMFGKKAGTGETTCEGNPKWTVSLEDFIENNAGKSTQKTSDGKGETSTTDTDGARKFWEERCLSVAGAEITYSQSSRKSLLQTRFECLGLDWKTFKGWFKAKDYNADCSKVNSDPLEFTYSVTKNKKEKKRLEDKVVIALLAKVTSTNTAVGEQRHRVEKTTNDYYSLKGQEIVLYAQMGNKFSKSLAEIKALYDPQYCELTKLVAFVSNNDKKSIQKHVKEANFADEFISQEKSAQKRNPTVMRQNGEDYTVVEEYTQKEYKDQKLNSANYFRGQIDAARQICNGEKSTRVHPLTLNGVYDIADFVSPVNKIKEKSIKECKIYDLADKPFIKEKYINGKECNTFPSTYISMKGNQTASARITRPNDKVNIFAVLVEENSGESKSKVIYTAKMNDQATNCKGKTCDYVLESGAFGSKGFNPNQGKDGQVKTNYNNSTSSSSSTDNTQSNELTSNEIQELNRVNQPLQNNCIENHCYKLYPEVSEKQSACIQQCKNAYPVRTGNYQGNSESSSDGNDAGTAPGAGRVYWILTEADKLLVKIGDEFEGTIYDIEPTQFAAAIIDISYCPYRWCFDTAACNMPDKTTGNYCLEDGIPYIAHPEDLEGTTYYIKTTRVTDVSQFPDDTPDCDKLCYRDGKIYKCDQNGDPDKPICNEDPKASYYRLLKPCPTCCTYKDGNMYPSVKIKDKLYITDATKGKCNTSQGECIPAAWSEEDNFFAVYNMIDLNLNTYSTDTLPLIPTDNTFVAAISKTNETVNLSVLEQQYNSVFTEKIKQQSIDWTSNQPTLFELFPKLELPKEVEIDLVNACNFCGPSLYDNADVRADEVKAIQPITAKIRNCFEQVRQLEQMLGPNDPDVQQLKSVYFYGYASKRGSHKPKKLPGRNGNGEYNVGCTTSGADYSTETDEQDEKWGYCNKALSEDRNLYIMDKVIGNLSEFSIDVDKVNDFSSLRGFTNTIGPVKKTGTRPSYRLIKHPKASGDEFTFISYPCGSDGAPAKSHYEPIEDHDWDRLVLITPINEGQDYCQSRMTCEVADKKMRKIEENIKAKLSKKKIQTYSAAKTSDVVPLATVTESDGSSLSNEAGRAFELIDSESYKGLVKAFKSTEQPSRDILNNPISFELSQILTDQNNEGSQEKQEAASILKFDLKEALGEEGYQNLVETLHQINTNEFGFDVAGQPENMLSNK